MSFSRLSPSFEPWHRREGLNLPEDFSLDDVFGDSLNSDNHEQTSSDSSSPRSIFDDFFAEVSSSQKISDSNNNKSVVPEGLQTIQAPSNVKKSRRYSSKYDGIKMVGKFANFSSVAQKFILTFEILYLPRFVKFAMVKRTECISTF